VTGRRGAGRREPGEGGVPARPGGRARRIAASLALGLLLLEVGLRFVLGNFGQSKVLQRSEDPDVCLELRPGVELTYTGWRGRVPASQVRTNSYGIRGPEFSFDKTPGELRIVAVGDSFTFGQGVEEEQTFAQVAGRTLEQAGIRNEVLNFGVPGHATPQSVALVRERALVTRPDLVLVHVFANDLSEEESWCLYGQGDNAVAAWLVRNVYVGRLAFFLARPLLGPKPPADARERLGSPEERFQAALGELAELGRANDFLTAVVLLTDRVMFVHSSYCQGCPPAHDLVPGTGVHVVDMSAAWQLLQDDVAGSFIPGDDHLSVTGNALMGESLGRALADWAPLRARAEAVAEH
jgi:hypothetical protein